eukprot:TRINITY_DN5644_c1_g1_i1.p1 TRINITY_DN5644_c1_g1~~TRINITY_DN5644_c1_g1_i1.p1  ORF type:complete len:456 (+),score=100.80 TRINITY_DN5644_c1_g1_i1:93-1460(+)
MELRDAASSYCGGGQAMSGEHGGAYSQDAEMMAVAPRQPDPVIRSQAAQSSGSRSMPAPSVPSSRRSQQQATTSASGGSVPKSLQEQSQSMQVPWHQAMPEATNFGSPESSMSLASTRPLAAFGQSAASSSQVLPRRAPEGEMSEARSESSTNVSQGEYDVHHLERFYEAFAAKAKFPEQPGVSSNWVLSLARGYRKLSKDKRRRGRLKALLQRSSSGSVDSSAGHGGCIAGSRLEHSGWTSNTDDSGYEAGYETDADESELSEWESASARQGHKRKIDALVNLTFKLGLSEKGDVPLDGSEMLPPSKTPRAYGPGALCSSSASRVQYNRLAAPPPSPGGSAPSSTPNSPRLTSGMASGSADIQPMAVSESSPAAAAITTPPPPPPQAPPSPQTAPVAAWTSMNLQSQRAPVAPAAMGAANGSSSAAAAAAAAPARSGTFQGGEPACVVCDMDVE